MLIIAGGILIAFAVLSILRSRIFLLFIMFLFCMWVAQDQGWIKPPPQTVQAEQACWKQGQKCP